MPARLIANALVEAQRVRLRGRIAVPDDGAERVRKVAAGEPLPDFTLLLDDGVAVAVHVRAAAAAGQLRVLDLDGSGRRGGAPGPSASRFRLDHPVEVAGIARRAHGRAWTLEAGETLTVLFPAPGAPPIWTGR
jgi:hypothetical protein